jgi:hypothetical protein
MKKIEGVFISSKLDAVKEMLSKGCPLDMSRNNRLHNRGGAVFFADPPVVRLQAVVSDAQAMPAVQAILRASRSAPGIDVVSIAVSKGRSIVRRFDFATTSAAETT